VLDVKVFLVIFKDSSKASSKTMPPHSAFVSIYRNKIIEGLVLFEVPAKLIRLIECTEINTAARIKINTISLRCRCNIKATRCKRKYVYSLKTMFCLC